MIEVPLHAPLSSELPYRVQAADELLDRARALLEEYGVRVVTRILRARRAGDAIVEEAERRNAELVIVGSTRRARGHTPVFGRTVYRVLRASPCRVLVAGEAPA